MIVWIDKNLCKFEVMGLLSWNLCSHLSMVSFIGGPEKRITALFVSFIVLLLAAATLLTAFQLTSADILRFVSLLLHRINVLLQKCFAIL